MLFGFLITLLFFIVLGAIALSFFAKRLEAMQTSISDAFWQTALLGIVGLSLLFGAVPESQLDGLEGQGKPLPNRSTEAVADRATAVAVRIMAEADAIPEEFKLKKLLHAAKRRYARTESDEGKHAALALIADLKTRYNIAVEARRKFMGG